MKQIISTISSKGQVTIPAEVRRHLGVGTSEKIAFVIEEDGRSRSPLSAIPALHRSAALLAS